MAMHVIHRDFRGALNTVAKIGNCSVGKMWADGEEPEGSDKNRTLSKRKL